jgi:UbiD family decarboxylase
MLADSHRRESAPDLLSVLPALRHSAEDAAPYLTSGILVARSGDRGPHHYCFVRMAMVGANRLVVNPATRRMRGIVESRLDSGQPLEVAILIGAPAEVVATACTSAPPDRDKFEVAQALADGRLDFAGDRIAVPGATEIVLTGTIEPTFEREGPVGDQKGLYSVKERNPVCVVGELWAREAAIFHAIAGGVSREHVELVTLGPRAVLERIRRTTPGIVGYALPRCGGGRLAVLVAEGGCDPAAVAERLWAISSVRGTIVVNQDVDAEAGDDLLWALLERAKLPADFLFSPAGPAPGGPRKFLIDATVRSHGDWNERRIRVYHPSG